MSFSSQEVEQLKRENAQLREEIRFLRQKIDALVRRIFGAKSETLDPAQLQLLLGGMEDESPGQPPASVPEPGTEAKRDTPKAHSRRPRIPEHLPVVEEFLDPDPVKGCPEAWRCIGAEVSEQLDYEPGRFLRRRTVRRKYVKRSDPQRPPIIAPLPERPIEGGLLAPGLLAHIVISKYADHLPLYRQEQIYRQRFGVELPRQTLCRAVQQVADWVQPVVREILREQFAGGYVQADETPVKYLDPGAGKTAQGYLWTTHVPDGDTVYHWNKSRGHGVLLNLVPKDFEGTVQCDGYGAYPAFANKREGIRLAGCWVHARRPFFEAHQAGESPPRVQWVLGQIRLLYGIEERLRRSRAGPALREAVRQSESRMIVQRIGRVLRHLKLRGRHLPRSLMGQAIDYALGQWPLLERYLEEGRLEIDNNLVENRIRPVALGRKNWLFIGAEKAGERSALIYSIITSCRNRGIDPHAYLRDLLEKLPSMKTSQLSTMTPAAWAARAAAMQKAS